ncbi:MAG: RagB/SusD family nutrient uptake outer membrane protein [Dysgonomonas sp.]|nr:RagB/SusD family nutrient uptake outer membrane protein [Dysgonomonas sp.]
MKKIKYIPAILLAASISFTSCGDILDINPVENNTSNKFYANEIEINQAALGIYARLGKNSTNTDFPTEYFWLTSENRSDILYIGGSETSAQNDQLELRKYLIGANSGTVSTIFSRLYALIKDANNLLAHTSDNEYVRYRAEACFLRAYAYFELVRSFGPVALITAPIENKEATALPRESEATIYAQIISDLEYAAEKLENVYTGEAAGRVGSLAAKTLLAQVYITMAGYPLNDNSGYTKAENTLSPVIQEISNRFAPNYADIFTLANENKYDLFSVQFESGRSGVGSSLPGYITNSGAGASPFPEWTYSSYGMQGQDMRVDSLLVKEMKLSNDKRFKASIDTGYWNSLNVETRTWIERNIITKFLEKDNTNNKITAWNDFPRNFPILRSADAYLIYAEALINNGKAAQAKEYVNKIKERAGLPLLSNDPTLEDIKTERKKEFIGEGRRYFDLVRWGETEAIKVLTDFATYYHSKTNGQLPSKRDLLLPIPQNELKNRNNWDQNFGY